MNPHAALSATEFLDRLKNRTGTFWKGRGMVLVLVEGTRAQVHFIDGVHRCQWEYTNQGLTLDWLGELCLDRPPLSLHLEDELANTVSAVVRTAFTGDEVVVTPLWQVDRRAPDYERIREQHQRDVGIRVSLEGSLISKATITWQLLEHLVLSGSKDALAVLPPELADHVRTSKPNLYQALQLAHARFAAAQTTLDNLRSLNPLLTCKSCGHTWHFCAQRTETISFGHVLVSCPACTVLAAKYT